MKNTYRPADIRTEPADHSPGEGTVLNPVERQHTTAGTPRSLCSVHTPRTPLAPLSPLCAASLDQTERASVPGVVLDETSQRGEQGVDVLPGPERDDGGPTAGRR
ncbi:hypothetical protein GCM10010390_87620 [Streptomyces mordarskii]|uniref:Uncharacterized protein n=1 Tax=Streptomyces mordarskii TaxID=1226758 RepID=A0ABP3PTM9_9ACTN